ncbi:MAG: glycosyltransferase family 2 protein [Methylotenera sp.]|nr:glycosyltransferase family 2 protein [Methylotenera sp.]
MMILLEICLIVLGCVLLIPSLLIFTQTVAAIFLKNRRLMDGKRLCVAVIIPAHNEEAGIVATLASLIPQLLPEDRIVVVADNCSDQTANVARQTGVEVIERSDTQRRGKGYALDCAIQFLSPNPPQVVMIIDADCQSDINLLSRLAKACDYYQRPVQALDMMHAHQNSGLKVKMAAFAWLFKNKVRALGYANLGLPCQLMGTGMAFPWKALSKVNVASGEIVEDLKLGLNLAKLNTPPLFCVDVMVESKFPESESGLNVQRTRWEHGHLAMMIKAAPGLIMDALKSKNFNLFAMVLDMIVPPLALLAMMIFLYLLISIGWFYVFAGKYPLMLALSISIFFGVAVFGAWLKFGRDVISLVGLLYVPFYVLRKIPLYLKFILNRQVEWVRSNRDKE